MSFRQSHKFVPIFFAALLIFQNSVGKAQTVTSPQREPNQSWVGQRIIMLKGTGEVWALDRNGQRQMKRAPNIVAPVARVDEEGRVWILTPGEVEPAGWVAQGEALLLKDAIPYLTSLIERNPQDWDSFFRRAEAHHALNQRDDAIADYTTAIQLRPRDSFLYARRARSFHAMQKCDKALADYDEVIRLEPNAAEPYSIQASIYVNCPDARYQDPRKAIAAAEKAIALDRNRPTFLTMLAAAYARAGQLEQAIAKQKQALSSPQFPPAYREAAEAQLRKYEQTLATQKIKK